VDGVLALIQSMNDFENIIIKENTHV